MPYAGPQNGPIEVQVDHLVRVFGERTVLSDISTTIHAGEIVCIVGASGSGKTVLLDHLIGLLTPSSGRILVADHNRSPDARGQPPLIDIATLDEDALDLLRLHWGVVFQRNALFSGSVHDNVALWLKEHTTLAQPEIDRRVRESIKAVQLDVSDVINKDRDALSGGMAKRVAIARAIAADPLVIFYDEPTTGLDPVIAGQIHELIFAVHNRPVDASLPIKELSDGDRAEGQGPRAESELASTSALGPNPSALPPRTSIIVTHDRDLLRRLAPRVVMLHEGTICYDGPYSKFGGPDCPPAQEYLRAMPVLQKRRF